MTDKQLDEKFVKTFENVHADLAVKARIRKELTGDNMNSRNITVNGETAQHITKNKAAVKPTGRIIAAAAALVIAVGGGYYLKQRAANVNIDDSSSAVAAADLNSAESVITNSDLSFADSYTAKFCKKLDERHFCIQLRQPNNGSVASFDVDIDGSGNTEKMNIAYTTTRIINVDGDDLHYSIENYNSRLQRFEYSDYYYNDDGWYEYRDNELSAKHPETGFFSRESDPDNQNIYDLIFNSTHLPGSWTFVDSRSTNKEIIEHFKFTESYSYAVYDTLTEKNRMEEGKTTEHELILHYDITSGDLIKIGEIVNGTGPSEYEVIFTDEPGNVIAPDYGKEEINSDVSFEDSYTAAFLKKLDSRHFSAELELVYTETDNSDAVKNPITRIVEYNGHDTHGRVISYNGLGEPMTTDVYVNDDGTYNYLNGELQNKDTTPSYKNTDTDTDNTIIYKNFFNESIAPISPAAMTFKGIETTDTQIIEHFTYADGNSSGYQGGKNSNRPEHEVSFTYDKETGDLIQFANSLAGEGTNTCIVKSFSEDVGDLKAPDSTSEVITIPNLVGQNIKDVQKEWIGKLNINIEDEYSDIYDEGTIFWQSLSEGKTVEPGCEIAVKVSRGKPLGEVPDVVSTEAEVAESTLRAAEFTPVIEYKHSDTVEKGLVIGTEPAAGTSYPLNGTVTVIVSGDETTDTEELRIRVDLPEGIHGSYLIEIYHDGDIEFTQSIPDGKKVAGSGVIVDISGKGTQTYTVTIKNDETGKSVNYCTYIVDFDKKTATLKDGGFNKDGLLAITPAE